MKRIQLVAVVLETMPALSNRLSRASLALLATGAAALITASACSPHRSQAPQEDRTQVRIANLSDRSADAGVSRPETPRSPLDSDWKSFPADPVVETRFLSPNPLINRIRDVALRTRLSSVWDWLEVPNQSISVRHMQNALEHWVRDQDGIATHPALKDSEEEAKSIVDEMIQKQLQQISAGGQSTPPSLSERQVKELVERVRFFSFMMRIGDLSVFLATNSNGLSPEQRVQVEASLKPMRASIVARFALAPDPKELNHMDLELKRILDEARVQSGLEPLALGQYPRYQ